MNLSIIILSLILILSQCSLNKVVLHHGVHNLDKKQIKLKINNTNKNYYFIIRWMQWKTKILVLLLIKQMTQTLL